MAGCGTLAGDQIMQKDQITNAEPASGSGPNFDVSTVTTNNTVVDGKDAGYSLAIISMLGGYAGCAVLSR